MEVNNFMSATDDHHEKKRDEKRSDKIREVRKRVRWTPAELEKFIESAKRHGKNYAQISEELGTKTRSQVAKYANDLYHKACSAPEGTMPHAEFIKEIFKPFGCEKTVHIWQKDE